MKRVWLPAPALLVGGVAFGVLTMLVWMIDETHFDRPDREFDRLAARIENVPVVTVDARERRVEAPSFADPSSWIQPTVDEARLPGMLAAACTHSYPDAVAWSLRVRSDTGTSVTLYTDAAADDAADGERCPDFGFDAVRLVAEVARSVPGADLQAAVWDNGRFALVVLDEDPGALSALLAP